MELGVGLPTNVKGATKDDVVGWAARAEELGFASIGVTDRAAGYTWEPLMALAAAAAVTSRCRLMSNVVIVPNRVSAGLLAKQVATLDQLAEGRLVVGVGVGDREPDYALTGAPMEGRHRRLDEMLDAMEGLLGGSEANPNFGPGFSPEGPTFMIGGRSRSTFRRAARRGLGWTVSIATPEQVAGGIAALREEWEKEGRSDRPRVVALTYYGLGERAAEETPAYLRSYYEFIGPAAEMVATTSPTDAASVEAAVGAFAAAGADELIFLPTLSGAGQLELLADALGCRP